MISGNEEAEEDWRDGASSLARPHKISLSKADTRKHLNYTQFIPPGWCTELD